MKKLAFIALLATALAAAGAATASAPPVGKLPPSPVTTITTHRGQLFALALPEGKNGLVWRGAKNTNWRVATPVREADVGTTLVLIYRAGKPGIADVAYGLTKGETPKAYRVARFHIVVR